jgi:hypothetical protein
MSTIGGDVAIVLADFKELMDGRAAFGQLATLLADNIAKEQILMSQITDWAATEGANLAAVSKTLDNLVTGIAALDALIANFQNSPGTLSAADQAALDGIQAASGALVTKAAAIVVAAPVPVPAIPPAAG